METLQGTPYRPQFIVSQKKDTAMKKSFVNAGLFLAGYFTINIAVIFICAAVWLQPSEMSQNSPIGNWIMYVLFCVLLLGIAAGVVLMAIDLLQRAFKESYAPWVVLKKGSAVQINKIRKNESHYCLEIQTYPFNGKEVVIEFERNSSIDFVRLKEGFKYFWTGKAFQSVVEA